jgi:hypothetical protein
MNEKKEIVIRQIENRDNEYFAYFKCDFLQSTFSIFFNDNIFGAVSLNRFYEMIRSSFEIRDLTLKISEEIICFKNKAILEEIRKIESVDKSKQEILIPERSGL